MIEIINNRLIKLPNCYINGEHISAIEHGRDYNVSFGYRIFFILTNGNRYQTEIYNDPIELERDINIIIAKFFPETNKIHELT